MMYRVDIEVVAPVHPTEDPQAVAEAVTAIFPSADWRHANGEIIATAHSVERFVELLERQRIQETARATLHEAIEGSTIAFALSKQAATVGVVNFALENPPELGDLHVHIRVDQPSAHHLVEMMTAPDVEPVEGDVA